MQNATIRYVQARSTLKIFYDRWDAGHNPGVSAIKMGARGSPSCITTLQLTNIVVSRLLPRINFSIFNFHICSENPEYNKVEVFFSSSLPFYLSLICIPLSLDLSLEPSRVNVSIQEVNLTKVGNFKIQIIIRFIEDIDWKNMSNPVDVEIGKFRIFSLF